MKKILCVKFSYARLGHSDWFNYIAKPIRMLRNELIHAIISFLIVARLL